MSNIPQFTHLHVHSQYSLLDGMSTIKGLVDKAIADGQKAIALTDHGNMFGVKEFINYVSKVNASLGDEEKIIPIIGCEMYVAKDRKEEKKRESGKDRFHLVVLAKNEVGYHNLIRLVSEAWTEGFYHKPRTDRYSLEKMKEGLIVCSACLGGEVPQLILGGDLKEAEERILWYKQTFGDDYYIELQRHRTDKPNSNREIYSEQCIVNEKLIELARKHDIKLVATNDVHFVDEDDAEAHDRLICVNMQKNFNDPDRMHYSKQEWMKTRAEMAEIFADIPEALDNTMEVASKVKTYTIDHGPIMPNFEIPESFGSEAEYRSRISEQELFDEFTRDENGNVVLSEEDAKKKIVRLGGYDKLYRIKFEADYLQYLTYKGAEKRYGNPLSEEINERLRFELHTMKTMGFPGYFLIVQDFIAAGREKLDVSVGPGRGSAAGSAVAYCLGITQIDPIKYDLLFERFLNPDRISLPDIDVDFDDVGRGAVLKYVTDKYGASKVAHIITYGSMATKMAIKDVGRVMGMSPAETTKLVKLIPERLPDVDGKSPKVNFANCAKYDKDFAEAVNSSDPLTKDVMRYAGRLEGTLRNTGVHACGVIICRDDVTDWVPVSTAKDANGENVITTQFEGSVIEETGLIKMDFLGLRTLSIIRAALENIRRSKGVEVDIDNIPLDDAETFKLYCEGRTTATFQFESPGMQNSLRELQPSKFEDLIAMNALYRPGPMAYIPQFIARKHGDEPIEYDIPVMEKYLAETYGITVYQEQVMLLSRLLADFTRGESDVLRKAMGKKQIDKMAKLKVKFLNGGQSNGYKADTLEKIWADWEKFASYAFNKSHATCYSWVAYQTAYLKANYPAEYMAGVMSCNVNSADKLEKFMDECKSMGIKVKGPDINESYENFGVTEKGEIRFGLAAIKGVGGGCVTAIIEERDSNGPFKDIFDFVERVNISACGRSPIESLAMAGAFDCFDDFKREVVFAEVNDTTFSDVLVKYGQKFQADKNSLQASLFGDFVDIATARPPYPKFEPWSQLKLLEEEKRMVTMYLSAHPLDPYYMEIKYGCNTECKALKDISTADEKLSVGGLVVDFQTRLTQRGTPYGVLLLEDYSGRYEFRLFGKTYTSFSQFGIPGTAIYITGTTAENKGRPGQFELKIEDIRYLTDMKGKVANNITIEIDSSFSDPSLSHALDTISKTSEDEHGGTVNLKINTSMGRPLLLKSRKHYPINRHLVEMLTEYNLPFHIH